MGLHHGYSRTGDQDEDERKDQDLLLKHHGTDDLVGITFFGKYAGPEGIRTADCPFLDVLVQNTSTACRFVGIGQSVMVLGNCVSAITVLTNCDILIFRNYNFS